MCAFTANIVLADLRAKLWRDLKLKCLNSQLTCEANKLHIFLPFAKNEKNIMNQLIKHEENSFIANTGKI
ncbi:unnamed protein product [Gordionus sp. m RMFG-2023]